MSMGPAVDVIHVLAGFLDLSLGDLSTIFKDIAPSFGLEPRPNLAALWAGFIVHDFLADFVG